MTRWPWSVGCVLFLSLAALAGAAADGPPVVDLPFDDSLEDRGTNHFAARATGDDVLFMQGPVGRCLFIGGAGDWVDVNVDERLDLHAGATLQFWFKRDDWTNPYKGGSGWQTLAHVDGIGINLTAPGCPLHEPWQMEGTVENYEPDAGRVSATARSGAPLVKPLAWYHVAITFDAEAARADLYVNGTLRGAMEHAPVPAGDRVNPLRIGTWFKSNQAFRGWIDDLKIYDYPRSAEQIARDAAR